MRTSLLLALSSLLLLSSCLENEEEITVRADGSVAVRVAVRGDADDIEERHPCPSGIG